jgi:hypothetical protein
VAFEIGVCLMAPLCPEKKALPLPRARQPSIGLSFSFCFFAEIVYHDRHCVQNVWKAPDASRGASVRKS